MFAEERPALGPLPLEPFRYYQYGRRTVHLDGCVEVAAAYYSAPPGWIGRRVDVQWNGAHVRLLDPRTGQLLREHLRAPRGWHRIADPDRPARTPPKTLALLAAAKRAGPAISAVCDHIHRHDGPAGVRRILGVLALARKHGPAVVEQAANAALEFGFPTYRFVRRYLDRRPAPPLSLRQVDPLIRELTFYRDLIDRRTGPSATGTRASQYPRRRRFCYAPCWTLRLPGKTSASSPLGTMMPSAREGPLQRPHGRASGTMGVHSIRGSSAESVGRTEGW